MASCSSSASRCLSPASRSTWSSDVDRRPRDGAPSCVTTHRTLPPWTCSLFRPDAGLGAGDLGLCLIQRNEVITLVDARDAMGIRDKPIAPGAPWQNCFAERLIGTIRRECVDHVVAFSEEHLRQVLKSYASYYNTARTHRSLDKDAPVSRPVQRTGRIVSHALVGGMHHQYVRI